MLSKWIKNQKRNKDDYFFLNILGLSALILFTFNILSTYYPEFKPLLASFCHQKTDRTFEIHGHLMGFCARCTGIYAGLSILFLGLPIIQRYSATISRNWLSIALLVFEWYCYAMASIAIYRYAVKWDDVNLVRLLYGLQVGFASGWLCYRYKLWLNHLKLTNH